jgi:hypothetical protein
MQISTGSIARVKPTIAARAGKDDNISSLSPVASHKNYLTWNTFC